MQSVLRYFQSKISHGWQWIAGFLALGWVLLRSGTNPKRLAYPCQRAALPVASVWISSLTAFLLGSLLLRRCIRFCGFLVTVVALLWMVVSFPRSSRSEIKTLPTLPAWEVNNPVSLVFVMDSLPPTPGSLAAGDATVPDQYLPDPAIDTLLLLMAAKGIYLHKTVEHPTGLVDSDNVVIIKGNFQWTSRNTTSTDRIKGLIWQILNHTDGFTGEILVCDNTQDIGTGIGENDNNSEDTAQSIVDVVTTFQAKGYPVYYLDWNYIWSEVASEYFLGDYHDGYVYETHTRISYPKFLSPSGNHYISLKYGVWNSAASAYDSARLCIIDFPVLKAHSWAGATVAVKNWIGVLTTAYAAERFGDWNNMHNTYYFGPYALVARTMAATFPRLSIVDAAWTTTYGPVNLTWVQKTDVLVASTDPVAVSWYAAKYILTPIARYPAQTNPDGNMYGAILGRWTSFLVDSAGLACTKDSALMSVYDRCLIMQCCVALPGDANASGTYTLGDVIAIVNYIFNKDGCTVKPLCWLTNLLCRGDWNGSTTVSLSDVIQAVNYIFNKPGGPWNAMPVGVCCLP